MTWVTRKIGDICQFEYGKSLPEFDRLPIGGYPAYGANGIKARSKKFLCDKKTIIIGRKGSAGELTYTEENFWPLDVTYFLKFDEEKYDLNFLYFLLLNQNLTSLAKGVKPGINRHDVYKLAVSVPSTLQAQVGLANKLTLAFNKLDIAIQNLQIEQDNIKAIFDAYLINTYENLFESAKEIKPIGEVFTTSSGGTPLKAKKEFYSGGTIPWLQSGEVSQKEITASSNFITDLGLKNSSAKIFQRNTVLVAMYGATAGQVGILKFNASTNQAICGVLENNNFLPEFVYFYFLYKKKDLVSLAVGNAQPNISQLKIKSCLFPIVSKEVQEKTLSKIGAMEKLKDGILIKYQKKMGKLNDLKWSLLKDAFSGNL